MPSRTSCPLTFCVWGKNVREGRGFFLLSGVCRPWGINVIRLGISGLMSEFLSLEEHLEDLMDRDTHASFLVQWRILCMWRTTALSTLVVLLLPLFFSPRILMFQWPILHPLVREAFQVDSARNPIISDHLVGWPMGFLGQASEGHQTGNR